MTQERLILFYLGERGDDRGRTLAQIWEWDVEELECTHDYIQWLFPLPEHSVYNSNAPIVDANVISSFHHNSLLRQNLHRALTVMLRFYGVRRQ
jgi:Opioid growth factor receptor (OGFr) conserved region